MSFMGWMSGKGKGDVGAASLSTSPTAAGRERRVTEAVAVRPSS